MKEAEAIAAIARHQPANLVRYPRKPWAGRNQYQRNYLKQKRLRQRKQAIALLGGRCLDCKLPFSNHLEVFEFDHTRGTKEYEISKLLGGSWRKLAPELKKCDLVCSNCHRIRTAHRAR